MIGTSPLRAAPLRAAGKTPSGEAAQEPIPVRVSHPSESERQAA